MAAKKTSADKKGNLNALFTRWARSISQAAGRPAIFLAALGIIIVWAVTGPLFKFSDTWQLVINTGTTIITFLMVFLIQNTQNRDTEAMQLKLDEVIRAMKDAKDDVLDLETQTDEEMQALRENYQKLARAARRKNGKTAKKGK